VPPFPGAAHASHPRSALDAGVPATRWQARGLLERQHVPRTTAPLPPPEELDALRAATGTDRTSALDAVRAAAAGCHDCPLWETGTQTVFGAGPASAGLLFVGEAPGFQEDKQGVPFVGPSGQLFDRALASAGIDRATVYVTNVVKHRPWIPGGAMGKNRPPKQSEINACRQWLLREVAVVRPRVVGCLGALSAKWFLGKDFKLTQQRGQWLTSDLVPGADILATVHPSFVLIQPQETHEGWERTFFEDVQQIAGRLTEIQHSP
jgi:DNA polymerase